jgi:8-oxo-dGTP diphosphatase
MTTRVIHLRRPVSLSMVEEPFVPGDVSLDEIEQRWQAAQRDNPHLYDGQLLHVIGVHRNGYGGAVVHVAPCSYRFHAVQRDDFDLGVRPLGVKGITRRRDDERILIGKRSQNVTYYPGQWEFAPAGVVEPDTTPDHAVLRELHEETGLAAVGEPVARALVYDDVIRCWEMLFDIIAEGDIRRAADEFDVLRWVRPDQLPDDASAITARVANLLFDAH